MVQLVAAQGLLSQTHPHLVTPFKTADPKYLPLVLSQTLSPNNHHHYYPQ